MTIPSGRISTGSARRSTDEQDLTTQRVAEQDLAALTTWQVPGRVRDYADLMPFVGGIWVAAGRYPSAGSGRYL